MPLAMLFDIALPGVTLGAAALGALALVVIFILIVFLEMVVLQLIGWGNLRESFRSAFWMNLASTIAGFLLLALVNRLAIIGLFLSWALSVLVEALVLFRLSEKGTRFICFAALSTNLASYLLLILPAFLMSD